MMASDFTFTAKVEVLGRPLKLLSGGRIGTEWNSGVASSFVVFSNGYLCSIAVVDGGSSGFLACDKDGYLMLQSGSAQAFRLMNDDTGVEFLASDIKDKVRVSLRTSSGYPVIQFEGPNGFERVETEFNWLIAAQKVEIVHPDRNFKYLVPDGIGAWTEYQHGVPYDPTPVSMVLSIEGLN